MFHHVLACHGTEIIQNPLESIKVLGKLTQGAMSSLPHGLRTVDRTRKLLRLQPAALAKLSLEPPYHFEALFRAQTTKKHPKTIKSRPFSSFSRAFCLESEGEIGLSRPVDLHVHFGHLRHVAHLADVDRLLPDRTALHLDEAVLVIEAPILNPESASGAYFGVHVHLAYVAWHGHACDCWLMES